MSARMRMLTLAWRGASAASATAAQYGDAWRCAKAEKRTGQIVLFAKSMQYAARARRVRAFMAKRWP